jgi:hypothetical protein
MKNIHTAVSDGVLTITVRLSEATEPSSSGKSEILASTGGSVDIEGAPGLKLGLNLYRPIKKANRVQ